MMRSDKIPQKNPAVFMSRHFWINGFLIVLAVAAIGVLLWPERAAPPPSPAPKTEEKPASPSWLAGLFPERWPENWQKNWPKNWKAQAQSVIVKTLEEHLGFDQMGASQIMNLAARYAAMTNSATGQNVLQTAAADLNSLFAETKPENAPDALAVARAENPALRSTFQGVPDSDLKAAALLLAVTQLRDALGRDRANFSGDLSLMQNLIGSSSDPGFNSALQRLAPYAESGVLTPESLTHEFKGLAGDLVVSSLKGEDVSWRDQAQMRLHDFLKLDQSGAAGPEGRAAPKDAGQPALADVPGLASVQRAESALQTGDLETAIREMRSLKGAAATLASPWIGKAEATLLAQNVKSALSRSLRVKGKSAGGSITANGGALFIPGRFVEDKTTGLRILKPGTLPAPAQTIPPQPGAEPP